MVEWRNTKWKSGPWALRCTNPSCRCASNMAWWSWCFQCGATLPKLQHQDSSTAREASWGPGKKKKRKKNPAVQTSNTESGAESPKAPEASAASIGSSAPEEPSGKLQSLQNSWASLKSQLGEDHPACQALQIDVDKLKQILDVNLTASGA